MSFLDNLLDKMKKENMTPVKDIVKIKKVDKPVETHVCIKRGNPEENLNIFYPKEKKKIDEQFVNFKPSNIRISTMTATCNLNSSFENLDLIKENICVCRTLYCEKKNCVKPEKKYRKFHNQKTVLNNIGTKKKQVLKNTKLFKNGKIQMTGLKKIEEINNLVIKTISILKKIHTISVKKQNRNILMPSEVENMKSTDLKICLINSDFETGFKISREVMFEKLRNKYHFAADFDPDNYPGVNAKFYWNSVNKNKDTFGICPCTKECFGKGTGHGDGNCRIITIFAFTSGKIMISGNSLEKMSDAYQYINRFIDENYNIVKREQCIVSSTVNSKPTKKLCKENIKNFQLYKELCAI